MDWAIRRYIFLREMMRSLCSGWRILSGSAGVFSISKRRRILVDDTILDTRAICLFWHRWVTHCVCPAQRLAGPRQLWRLLLSQRIHTPVDDTAKVRASLSLVGIACQWPAFFVRDESRTRLCSTPESALCLLPAISSTAKTSDPQPSPGKSIGMEQDYKVVSMRR